MSFPALGFLLQTTFSSELFVVVVIVDVFWCVSFFSVPLISYILTHWGNKARNRGESVAFFYKIKLYPQPC